MAAKRFLTALCLLLFCFASFSWAANAIKTEDDPDFQRKVQEELIVACFKNLCKIVGADFEGNAWSISFQVAYGERNRGKSDTILISGKDSDHGWDGGSVAISVFYKNVACRTDMRITPAVYRFVNTYLYGMVNSNGSLKKYFSPTDRSVILFYMAMINQVSICNQVANAY
ncbi:protease [Bdellovibrio reynosensis]|uniref:Protease n=1 Tax=Bdellovibrio reynosensis TaxID=2835041 RepID=A0ABY4C8F7_9BACT|nr:protease [Bdellovibrio reynosensis]UOF01014.1 protease [Bdellovibrio reynosensis]